MIVPRRTGSKFRLWLYDMHSPSFNDAYKGEKQEVRDFHANIEVIQEPVNMRMKGNGASSNYLTSIMKEQRESEISKSNQITTQY